MFQFLKFLSDIKSPIFLKSCLFYHIISPCSIQFWYIMFVILDSFWILTVIHCSLSALIENKIFSVHGGLSPAISTLDQVWASILAFIITVVTFNF